MIQQLKLIKENTNDKNNIIDYIDVNNKIIKNKRFNVISLFSGCGGMDLGFKGNFKVYNNYYEENNFDIIFSNDIEKYACETYEYNLNNKSICKDISNIQINDLPNADIVIGGFPCQDFSQAGKRKGLNSNRGKLYLEMKKVISYVKPKAFVAENVDGLITSKTINNTTAIDQIIEDFSSLGYKVVYKILNSADYGIPQTRKRVIIIGIKEELSKKIYYPKPVRKEGSEINPWMTAKEAIDDLWNKIGDPKINNHTEKDYSKAKFYPGKKMQGNYKIKADRPSGTIRAEHHGNIEAHYRTIDSNKIEDMKKWRRLSVRECARLQSFPDDFVFKCSASKAYKLVGNAVPPVLAWYISRALYYSLIID